MLLEPACKGPVDRSDELSIVHGLLDEVLGPRLDRCHRHRHVRVTRYEDNRDRDVAASELNHQTYAVRPGHPHIRDDAPNILLIEFAKKYVGRLAGLDAVPKHAEQLCERIANRRMIVDDDNRRRRHGHCTCNLSSGTENRNSVAPASRLWSHTRPPCASTIEVLIGRPRPRPSCFEVARGSNIRVASWSSTPGPLSWTLISRRGGASCWRATTRTCPSDRPAPAIASTAL